MHIDPSTLKQRRSDLQSRRYGVLAPRELVAALLTLTPTPDSIATFVTFDDPPRMTGARWTLLARQDDGIAYVFGVSGGRWNWRDESPAERFEMTARWVPLREVVGLELTEVSRFQMSFDDSGLATTETWNLLLRNGESVALHVADDEDGGDRQIEWLRDLQTGLSSPLDR